LKGNVLRNYRWNTFEKITLAAILLVIFTTKTFGQTQPGEDSLYGAQGTQEGDTVNLTRSSYSEIIKNGVDLEAWRDLSNKVVMAIDGVKAFSIATTETELAPTVVGWDPVGSGDSSIAHFLIFHTGVDGGIYFTDQAKNRITNQTEGSGRWQQVPGQTTKASVSVVEFDNRGDLFMAYQGAGSDESVYGTWYDNAHQTWHFLGNIGGGKTFSAPSVTFNPVTNQLWIVVRGLDNAVWYTHQSVGSSTWAPWTSLGRQTMTSPQIVAAKNGDMIISYVDFSENPWYHRFGGSLSSLGDWTKDSTGWQTFNPVELMADESDNVYSLFTGNDHVAYSKLLARNP
jgi:hypothetical protein